MGSKLDTRMAEALTEEKDVLHVDFKDVNKGGLASSVEVYREVDTPTEPSERYLREDKSARARHESDGAKGKKSNKSTMSSSDEARSPSFPSASQSRDKTDFKLPEVSPRAPGTGAMSTLSERGTLSVPKDEKADKGGKRRSSIMDVDTQSLLRQAIEEDGEPASKGSTTRASRKSRPGGTDSRYRPTEVRLRNVAYACTSTSKGRGIAHAF